VAGEEVVRLVIPIREGKPPRVNACAVDWLFDNSRFNDHARFHYPLFVNGRFLMVVVMVLDDLALRNGRRGVGLPVRVIKVGSQRRDGKGEENGCQEKCEALH
jgi:hypothetical protein